MARLTRLLNDDGSAAVRRYLDRVQNGEPRSMFLDHPRQMARLDIAEKPGGMRPTVRFDVMPATRTGQDSGRAGGLREWIDGYRSSPVGPTRREP